MIDFRYHIVSLISVFLALAVGIVLGAGPLRDYIADSLSGQVDQLREETEGLREELDLAHDSLDNANAFIDGASETLIDGVLPGYTVSIIAMPGVDGDLINTVGDTLTDAGASVLNIVDITEDFIDPTKRPFRSGIASNLSTYMDPEPGEDASAESIIGSALDQALTTYDVADPQEPSENSLSIVDLLKTSELITIDGDVLPTLLTVVLTSASVAEEEVLAAGLGLVKGLDETRTVIAGTDSEDSLLRTIRTDSDAAGTYTTTDSLTTLPGKIIIPRALAVVVDGEHGTFGFGDNTEDALPPRVEISEPEPVEPEEQDDEEAEDEEQDADAGAAVGEAFFDMVTA